MAYGETVMNAQKPVSRITSCTKIKVLRKDGKRNVHRNVPLRGLSTESQFHAITPTAKPKNLLAVSKAT